MNHGEKKQESLNDILREILAQTKTMNVRLDRSLYGEVK